MIGSDGGLIRTGLAGRGGHRGVVVAWAVACVLTATTAAAGTSAMPTPVELGWRSVERGDYRQALDHFEQAQATAPGESSVLIGLGLTYHLMGDTGRAIAALESAMQTDGPLHDAYALLGDLYLRRGDLERAIHHYRVAIQRKSDSPDLRTKLARARRAYRAQLEHDRLFTPHFVVYHHPRRVTSDVVHRVADRLEHLYREIGTALSFFPAEAFTVILYGGPEFWDQTQTPTWVSGLYDGVIHLPLAPDHSPVVVPEDLLRHEYAHAAVDRLSGGRVPVWLSEGLALYFEDPDRAGAPVPGGPSDPGAPVPLQTEFVSLAPVDAGAAYAHSYRATRHLIQRYGLTRIRTLLEEAAHHGDFSQTFAQVLGTGYREFERTWLGSGP